MTFVRYQTAQGISYGILDGETIRELRGDLFQHTETGTQHRLADVKLLVPCTPGKIVCIARNYSSHMGDRARPAKPEMFWKPLSCLQKSRRSHHPAPGFYQCPLRRRARHRNG